MSLFQYPNNSIVKSSIQIDQLYEEKAGNEDFRDKIATVDKTGKRVWVYPKKPAGKFTNWRTVVGVLLLVFLFGAPFVTINGQPLLLLNVFERRFVIFGQTFWPQDFHLFALAFIAMVVFIILFTVVFGRLFCGWICPQTIFMEIVFRKVEYWIEGDYMAQKKLDKQPWNTEKILKKTAKHFVFVLISALIMHTFMAYLVGVNELWQIVQAGPGERPGGFMAMVGFTAAFYFVFSRLREQVCTTVCPYGRLQGVLLDKNSINVSYDYVRGEKRAVFRKGEDRAEAGKGDCIDCKQCVFVCPTGIDIRNGTQLECVNCTACMDACDNIMDKIGRPRGLIRHASEESIAQKTPFRFTWRMKAYSAVMVILLVILSGLIVLRSDVETTVLRTPGMTYQKRDDGTISNLYNVKVINKSNRELPITLELRDSSGKIEFIGEPLVVPARELGERAIFIVFDRKDLEERSSKVKLVVKSGERELETVTTKFLAP